MKDFFVAILMERIVINNGLYLFKPLTLLEGDYLEDNNLFIDTYENTYTDALNSYIGIDEKTEFFTFPISYNELCSMYNSKDKKEILRKHLDQVYNYVYIGKQNENFEIDLLQIPIDNLEVIQGEIEIEKEDEYEEEVINYLLKTDNIEEIKDYLNKILSFSKGVNNEIEKIKKEIEINNTSDSLNIDINDLYNYVKSKVVGQDEAIKQIITNFIINYNSSLNADKLPDLQLTRCLITGSPGVGKTLIIETILEYLEKKSNIIIPIEKVTTSQLTIAGYHGRDLEDILEALVSKAPEDMNLEEKIKYAEKNGVVFFDEIDKKATSDRDDVSGTKVLDSLLEFLNGSSYKIFDNKKGNNSYYFNTKYLNIFFAGSFNFVRDLYKKQVSGFIKEEEVEVAITTEDYINKGNMTREFMRRVPKIIELNFLNEESLYQLLTTSTISPILIEQIKLSLFNISLSWDDSYIRKLAKTAHKLNLGASSLKKIIEESLNDLKWEALTNQNKDIIYEVTEETVLNPKQYKKL